jgi:hypothetical protein
MKQINYSIYAFFLFFILVGCSDQNKNKKTSTQNDTQTQANNLCVIGRIPVANELAFFKSIIPLQSAKLNLDNIKFYATKDKKTPTDSAVYQLEESEGYGYHRILIGLNNAPNTKSRMGFFFKKNSELSNDRQLFLSYGETDIYGKSANASSIKINLCNKKTELSGLFEDLAIFEFEKDWFFITFKLSAKFGNGLIGIGPASGNYKEIIMYPQYNGEKNNIFYISDLHRD